MTLSGIHCTAVTSSKELPTGDLAECLFCHLKVNKEVLGLVHGKSWRVIPMCKCLLCHLKVNKKVLGLVHGQSWRVIPM